MSRSRSFSAGYSMLELLVVLAIMSLILILAVPAATGSLQRLTLAGDARLVVSNLRSLRELAADQQTEISVTVPTARTDTLSASNGSEIRMSWGTDVQIVSRGDAGRMLTLSWDGSVSGTVILSRGGSTIRISADRLTGRLVVETAP